MYLKKLRKSFIRGASSILTQVAHGPSRFAYTASISADSMMNASGQSSTPPTPPPPTSVAPLQALRLP
jgi:hypothetical protein